MTDELWLLRKANPVSPDSWPCGPLHPADEEHLQALLSGRGQTSPGRSRGPSRIATGWLGAAAAAVVAVLLVLLSPPTNSPSPEPPAVLQPVAAPAPLTATLQASTPALVDLAARAVTLATEAPSTAIRGSHVRTWFLGFSERGEDIPPVVTPSETLSLDDGEGLIVTSVPADPDRPGQVRLQPGASPPSDAEVTYVGAAQAATDPAAASPPPTDPAAVGAYLTTLWAPGTPDLPGLLSALETTLDRWTPGTQESAALTGWLAMQPGLVPLGAVTDRLGRPGVAFTHDSLVPGAVPVRYTVILDADTGRIMSTELSFTGQTGPWDVSPFAVMSYTAYDIGQ